jgi:hypothetical protein
MGAAGKAGADGSGTAPTVYGNYFVATPNASNVNNANAASLNP